MLVKLETRIKQLADDIDRSAAQHNAMLGALNELKTLYNDMVEEEKKIIPVEC
jgi:hypothetical protein